MANAALWGAVQDWREGKNETFDEHGRNMPLPFESFPNTRDRIFTLREGVLHLTEMLWGMPTPPQYLVTKSGKPMAHDPGVTNVRNADSSHWRRWTGVTNRCLVPWTSFAENAPVTYQPTWFAYSDGRPLAFFAGIWDTHARRIRAKDQEPTQGEFFAFLTTEPNADVKPIHPKAMPVVLTSEEECRTWLTADWSTAKQLQRPLPDGTLKIVHRGKWPGEEGHAGGSDDAGSLL
jgi:putative SOS response-associated peptidase YedK